jgi:pimeloyl-ACP methyl ester carboxylesterase
MEILDYLKMNGRPVKRGTLTIQYRGIPVHIAYFIRPGEEKTVLSLHGLGSSKNDFARALRVRDLGRYSLAAFDFPGCGNSSYPEDIAFDVDDLVEITHLLICNLSLINVILLGHSMGGLVSLLYAERHGTQVKALLNVEGNLAPRDCFFRVSLPAMDLVDLRKRHSRSSDSSSHNRKSPVRGNMPGHLIKVRTGRHMPTIVVLWWTIAIM